MAKLSTVERTLKKKNTIKQCRQRREALIKRAHDVCKNPDATMEERMAVWMDVSSKLPRNASPTRLRKICRKTGRPRSNNFTGISRIYLRKMIAEGLVPGVYKSSW
jgi:ribosomal protein S14